MCHAVYTSGVCMPFARQLSMKGYGRTCMVITCAFHMHTCIGSAYNYNTSCTVPSFVKSSTSWSAATCMRLSYPVCTGGDAKERQELLQHHACAYYVWCGLPVKPDVAPQTHVRPACLHNKPSLLAAGKLGPWKVLSMAWTPLTGTLRLTSFWT